MTNHTEAVRNEVETAGRAHAARAVLGDRRTFKTGPRTNCTGTVVAVDFVRGKACANGMMRAVFAVTLECGPNKTSRTFNTYEV